MKLLGGRYETLKAIASGGMATVHLGRSIGVGGFERLVAIKVMHPHIACEPEFVAMFLDEARLAARIRHPNVVATIDVQEVEEGLFLVMEFVDGPSLAKLHKVVWRRGVTVPVEVTVRIMLDTLAGLHEAHELADDEGLPLQLVHRDVSPANILVGADGVVRITDFGVARAETRLSSTRGGQLKGKIPYMPPEQLLGETVDRRADVYASAAVLWEALTGQRLFSADNEGTLVQQIIQGPRQSPREVNSTVPEALDRACMRGLATSLTDRFATASHFAEALEEAAAADGIAIATSRAVAAFVERSGAHAKLDPKELAALKRSPSSATAMPPGLGSSPSARIAREAVLGSSPSSPGAAAATSGAGEAAADAKGADGAARLPEPAAVAPDSPPVTAVEATVSAKHDAPSRGRTGKWLFAGAAGALVVVVAVVGLIVGGGGDPPATGSKPDPTDRAEERDTEPASAARTSSASSDDAAPAASEEGVTAAPSATESATATASATADEPPAAPRPPTTRTTKPPTTKPPATSTSPGTRPPSTSYNPDRL